MALPKIILLNEFSVPRLLWRVLLGKPTCVLGTFSVVRGQAAGHLDWVVDRLRRFGSLVDVATLDPEIRPLQDYGDFLRLTDPFAEAEPWIAARFDFVGSDRRFGDFAVAYRHLCCNGVFPRLRLAHIVHRLRVHTTGMQIVGTDGLDRALEAGVLGTPATPDGGMRWRLRPLVNTLLALMTAARSTIWLLSRLRLRPPPRQPVDVAVDHVGNGMDFLLLDRLTTDRTQQLYVFRTPIESADYASGCDGRPTCVRREGWFAPRDLGPALVLALIHPLMLLAKATMLESDLFKVLVGLTFHRLVMRGLLNRFDIRTFVAHDDYNSEHAVHTLEMRRRGVLSIGMMHGLPSILSVVHQYRYLDFDLYFLLGRHNYERIYAATWPEHMRVVIAGSLGAMPGDFEAYDSTPPSPAILAILSPCHHMALVADAIAITADAFPEREIVLNVKDRKYMHGAFKKELDRLLDGSHANIRLDMGRSYDLMRDCSYVIGEGSTLIAEAVQFGKCALALDLDPRTKYHLYRDFSEISVGSGAELVDRINAFEAGQWTYPRDRLSGLIRLDGQRWYDIVPAAIEAAHAEQGRSRA